MTSSLISAQHPGTAGVRPDGLVYAFLPCRRGSERVPRKNIRPFGVFQNGLLEIKLHQLLACQAINRVVLSTNDQEVLEFAAGLAAGDRLIIHLRDESLSSSTTSTDALVGHARDLIAPLAPEGHILWTHVTSPFVTSAHYESIIADYRLALTQGYDSLMATTHLQSFLWSEKGPVNYDRRVEKWPRTQTLRPLHEVNSAAFLAPLTVYSAFDDRIGDNPRMHPLGKLIALDIDWEDDFALAELALRNGLVQV